MNTEAKLDSSDPWADRPEKCYTGAVYDTLRAMGLTDQNKVRIAILEGVDPVDACLQYRKF